VLRKEEKEREEKYEENKTNFEGKYLGTTLADSAQIWNWRCPTPNEFTQKILCVSVQGVLSYRCMKQCFLYSCKIHTCLSHALGRTTHVTVCLDTIGKVFWLKKLSIFDLRLTG